MVHFRLFLSCPSFPFSCPLWAFLPPSSTSTLSILTRALPPTSTSSLVEQKVHGQRWSLSHCLAFSMIRLSLTEDEWAQSVGSNSNSECVCVCVYETEEEGRPACMVIEHMHVWLHRVDACIDEHKSRRYKKIPGCTFLSQPLLS